MLRSASLRMLILACIVISAGLLLAADSNSEGEAQPGRYAATGIRLNGVAITDRGENKLYFYTISKQDGAMLDGVLDLTLVGEGQIPLTRTIPREDKPERPR